MKKRSLHGFALLCAGLLASPFVAHASKVGEPAPAFTLTDSDGKTRSLEEFKGKTVVLEWTNADCPFVKKHYGSGNLQQQQRNAIAQNIVWLSVNSTAKGREGNVSGADANKIRKEQKAAQIAYLIDEDGKVGHAYGAKTTPHLFVIDGLGVLRYNGAIDNVPSTKVEDLARATQYVPAVLASLKKGEAIKPSSTQPYGCAVKYPLVNAEKEEDCGC